MPIIKASAVLFSEPPHALAHPSQDEVISESLLSSLDVRSHTAAQRACRLECRCQPIKIKVKNNNVKWLQTKKKKVQLSCRCRSAFTGYPSVNTYSIKLLKP